MPVSGLSRKRSDDLSGLTEPFLPSGASHELTVDLCLIVDTQPSSYFRVAVYRWQDLVTSLHQITQDHASQRPLLFEVGQQLQHLLYGDKLILLQSVPVASAALSACKQLEQAVNRTYAHCKLRPLPYQLRGTRILEGRFLVLPNMVHDCLLFHNMASCIGGIVAQPDGACDATGSSCCIELHKGDVLSLWARNPRAICT